MLELSKYSLGIGDRFAHQAKAQLNAVMEARKQGIEITPVWNKSAREHNIIGSSPARTREQAGRAVKELGWDRPWFVDADHINMDTVDSFLEHADFFTLDVANCINRTPSPTQVREFVKNHREYLGSFSIPGSNQSFQVTPDFLEHIAKKYLVAVSEIYKIYDKISETKGSGNFITEVSMDEVDEPQSPVELFFVLKLLRDIPVQTIAPKFVGRFYKGVDYVGDLEQFRADFDRILSILTFARQEFNLREKIKISIHSGSDKFRLYPVIKELAIKHKQGLHLKTAGTTWLEEVIGLALAGSDGLTIAKEIYTKAYNNMEQLCAPYRNVINIISEKLPLPSRVVQWNQQTFANSLRHDPNHPEYNAHFRQLIHVGYKIAAQMGERFIRALKTHEETISEQVFINIFDRHIKRLFL